MKTWQIPCDLVIAANTEEEALAAARDWTSRQGEFRNDEDGTPYMESIEVALSPSDGKIIDLGEDGWN